MPFDLSHFGPHIANIKSALDTTEQLCKRISLINNTCDNIIEPLIARFTDMHKEYTSISHMLEKRPKRAWISGLGNVIKQIFGNLDENDGLRYDDAINVLQNNENKLVSLMKENILLSVTSITSFNNSVTKIKINEINLNKAIDKLSASFANITTVITEKTEFDLILNNLEVSILTLSFQLEDITNAILFSYQNVLHPSMITPQQLFKELADNYQHLPNDLELPIKLDISSIHIMLSVSRIISYNTNNKIFFILQIPLVSLKEYVLFHTIALPTPHNYTKPYSFSLILPSFKYIAMTKDKTQYCTLNDLKACEIITPGKRLCDVTTVYATDIRPICESEFMSKVISEIPKYCETKFIYGSLDMWKSIENNKWIYVQSESNMVSIECRNSKLLEVQVLGTGILTVPINCIGYCKGANLISKYITTNISAPIGFPDFNLINDTCCNAFKLNQSISNVAPIKLLTTDLDDLKLNKQIFVKQLHNIDNALDSPHIVRYGTHYSVVTLLVVIFILLYLCLRIYKCIRPGSRTLLEIPLSLRSQPSCDSNPENSNADVEAVPLPTIRTRV